MITDRYIYLSQDSEIGYTTSPSFQNRCFNYIVLSVACQLNCMSPTKRELIRPHQMVMVMDGISIFQFFRHFQSYF